MMDRPAPIVIALGGNAISLPEEEGNITQQFRQTRKTAAGLADLLLSGAPVVLTHGNGPQVGNAIRRVELSERKVYPLDLGICVADVQGGMGYMIAQCLMNELRHHHCDRVVATVVTTVETDPNDPAFAHPSKPIGSYFDEETAEQYKRQYGWDIRKIPSRGFRRVVPSPVPQAIVEIDLIRKLVEAGEIIITVGGGGIPVYRDENGDLQGYEAVIDKDLATGLLAREINAGSMFIVTDVEKVCLDYGKPTQRRLDGLTVDEAKRYLEEGQFPPGSMGPKIRAAVNFLETCRREDARVVICDIAHIGAGLAGRAGTVITRA